VERGLGGTAGVAGVGERPSVRAQERACETKNDPALAPLGGMTPQRATCRLTTADRRRAQLDRRTDRNGGRDLTPPRRTRAQVHGRVDTSTGAYVRARRGLGHGDNRDNGGIAATGIGETQIEGEGWLAGLRAWRRRQRHLQEAIYPSLARWPASHSTCAVAFWVRRSCPGLDGWASQTGGATVPHLSGHEPKCRRR
jgi:hypothetical protein